MAKYVAGYRNLEISDSTIKNYELVEQLVQECFGFRGRDVLGILTTVLGLQIFDEQTTIDIIEEIGFDVETDDE